MSRLAPRPLRLAIVTETYPPEINGVANTMRHLVEGLGNLGHHLTLVRPRQPRERRQPPATGHAGADDATAGGSIEHLLVPGLPIPGYRGLRFGLPVHRRLRDRWRETRPDALYIATQGPLGRAALRAAHGLAVPVLTGYHTQFHQYSRYYGAGLLMRPIVASLRRFHNASDGTLVPTLALRDELARAGFRHLHLFARGVDTALFAPQRRHAPLRAAWGCGAATLVALYVGRLAAEKNIDLAFDAFAAMAATHPDCRLVVVGDGPEYARRRHRHPECVFTGARVGLELARHYASADLFLFPSLTETFGNVVPEAMASGLAVLAFDDAAAREHIRHDENGLKVARGDRRAFIAAAVDAAADRARLRRIGAAARATAETLSWDVVIGHVEQRLRHLAFGHAQMSDYDESMATDSE